jgi:hypothetical protein
LTQVQFDTEGNKTIVVSNVSTQTIDIFTTAISGADLSDFKISNDLCIAQSLAPNASCSLDIVFAQAGSPGTKNAAVALEGGSSQQLLIVALVGVANHPATGAKVSPKGGFPTTALAALALAAMIAVGSLYYLRVRRRKNVLKYRLEEKE